MSNPNEGQVQFETGGKRWTLEITNRTERALQSKLKRPMAKVIGDLQSGDADVMVAVFLEGLQKHHPGTTEDTAIDLVRPRELRRLVTELLHVTYVGDDDPDPPKPVQAPETGPAN